MHLDAEAISCTLLPHGEHGAIVRLLTRDAGLHALYVRGARSRKMRPILMAGNIVAVHAHARLSGQLAHGSIELVHARASLLQERMSAHALEWLCGLVGISLPEQHPYPALYDGLNALLSAMEHGARAGHWAPALVRFELLLLAEMGFALDLSSCAATGTEENLIWVSPKSAQAVSQAAGAPYADKLLALPPFLVSGAHQAPWADVVAGMRLGGYFLERQLLHGKKAENLLAARNRLLHLFQALAPQDATSTG